MQIKGIQLDDMIQREQEWLLLHTFNVTDYEKQNGIYANRVGANIAMPNYHIGPRVTPYYYLLCVIEGEGQFIQQGKTYQLKENDIFCLLPQVIHEYYSNPKHPLKKFILAFNGKQAIQTLAQIGLTPEQPHRTNGVTKQTIDAFLQLFRHHDHPITRLSGIYTILQTLTVNQLTTSPTTAYENIDWLTQGKHHIEHYFLEQLTVEQIADKVGIERTHFTKMFTKRFNLSPMQYILQLRMNEASLLLQHTNYQIIEIAHAVGYQDISSFSKAFKRQVGVSPVRYRQQSQVVHKIN